PNGCPVTVEYQTGPSESKTIGPGGVLEFFALREREGFTLHFQFPAPAFPGGAYIASPEHGTSGDEQLLAATAALTHAGPFFLLPTSFRLRDATFTVTGAPNYDAATGTFGDLTDTATVRIGSAAA